MESSKKVLIIDDDELVRMMLTKITNRFGAEAITLKDGNEATDFIEQKSECDLIFLDLILPNSSGWSILNEIKASETLKDTPIVLLTGTAISDQERESLLGRTNDILDKKDFSISGFEGVLKKWL